MIVFLRVRVCCVCTLCVVFMNIKRAALPPLQYHTHKHIGLFFSDRTKVLTNCRALASALLDGLLDTLESPGEQAAATAALPFFLVCC